MDYEPGWDIDISRYPIGFIYSRIYVSGQDKPDTLYTARSAQREPPQTCAWSGGDFNFAGSHAWKAEVPPTSKFQVGGTPTSQAWLPAKLKSPHLKYKSWGVHAGPTQLYDK